MRAEEITEKVRGAVGGEIASMGYDLIEVSFSQGLLRLTIDTPKGVTLEDCVAVTRRVGLTLDTLDYIPGRYRLEVSSPGLTRRLTSRTDYEHFTGRRVKLILKQGSRCGVLQGVEGENLRLEVNGVTENIVMADIVKANLDFEF
ncbi:MAG: ribosome maturation factor RimP [Syntrophaceae bacterium]